MFIRQLPNRLQEENIEFSGTGGTSQENRQFKFLPAFMDTVSGVVHESRFKNGALAPFHSLDGLPDCWVTARNESGRVIEIRDSIISGFLRLGTFYTREEAAEFVQECH